MSAAPLSLAPGMDEAPTQAPRPAAPGSPLASLRERRAKAAAALHLDLEVPRLGGIWVRFRPMSSVEMNAITARVEGNSRVDKHRKPLVTNAALLAAACVGIFEVDETGEPVGTPEEGPKFDHDLAALLGRDPAELPTAADVVEALYMTHGDLMAAAVALGEWSAKDASQRTGDDTGEASARTSGI